MCGFGNVSYAVLTRKPPVYAKDRHGRLGNLMQDLLSLPCPTPRPCSDRACCNNLRGTPIALSTDTHSDVNIRGDLDARQGDIDTSGDVIIAGSILGNLTIRAGGNVEVNGHIDRSQILARGNVIIGGHLKGSRVRAGGRLVVGGEPETRVVDGGEAFAVGGVELRGDVGPSGTAPAAIGLLPDPETTVRLDKAGESLAFVENEMMRIMRTLGLKTLTKDGVEELFRVTPHNKRKFLIEILKQMDQLTRLREQLMVKQGEQRAVAAAHLSGIDLRVLGSVLEGVQVRIGDAVHNVTEVLRSPVFRLTDEAVHWRLDTDSAAGNV